MDEEPMIEVNRRAIGEMVLELIAENKQLKEKIYELENKNARLKEALSTCIPFTANSNRELNVCEFCLQKKHRYDCEYVKLTESEDI